MVTLDGLELNPSIYVLTLLILFQGDEDVPEPLVSLPFGLK